MKTFTRSVVLSACLAALSVEALPEQRNHVRHVGKVLDARDVDTRFPYTGAAIPVGDFVDPTVNGNGKGFPRLVEPPAVVPSHKTPTNNINVIALSYVPDGINVHYQTPFGLGVAPTIKWGTSRTGKRQTVTGLTTTYVFARLRQFSCQC